MILSLDSISVFALDFSRFSFVDFHFQLLIVDRLLLIRDFRLPQLDHIVADPLVLFGDNDLISADRSHRDQKHDQKTDQQGSVTDNQLLPLRVQSLAVISLPNLNNGVPLVSVVYCQIHLMVFLESIQGFLKRMSLAFQTI